MPYNASNHSAEHHRVTPEPAVGPVFWLDYAPTNKKEAERRQAH
jgi:hypothetical protein